MQATMKNSNLTGQKRPMCGLDYTLADKEAGRINHYASLDELLTKVK